MVERSFDEYESQISEAYKLVLPNDQAFYFNAKEILDEACRITRADMTTAEQNQFYEKYIKNMRIEIAPMGRPTIVLGK